MIRYPFRLEFAADDGRDVEFIRYYPDSGAAALDLLELADREGLCAQFWSRIDAEEAARLGIPAEVEVAPPKSNLDGGICCGVPL